MPATKEVFIMDWTAACGFGLHAMTSTLSEAVDAYVAYRRVAFKPNWRQDVRAGLAGSSWWSATSDPLPRARARGALPVPPHDPGLRA